jgi:hypothetical protein
VKKSGGGVGDWVAVVGGVVVVGSDGIFFYSL